MLSGQLTTDTKEGGREGGREGWRRDGGREGGREGGRREGGREGVREEGWREGGREGGRRKGRRREGGRKEGGREGEVKEPAEEYQKPHCLILSVGHKSGRGTFSCMIGQYLHLASLEWRRPECGEEVADGMARAEQKETEYACVHVGM